MEDDLEFDVGGAVADIGEGLGFLDGAPATDNDAGVKPAEETAAAASAEPTAKPTDQSAAQPAASTEPVAEPPKTWRAEAKAIWATIPPEAKAEILKREEDIFRGIEGYKADAAFGKSVQGVIAPYLPILQQYNIDPKAQIQGLMQAHFTLATGTAEQKAALFTKLASDYGVDLTGLQGLEAPYTDPAVKSLQSELQAVKSKLSEADRIRQEAAIQEKAAEVETFAKDPANVHFDKVANDMVALLEKGICKTLPEAYEKAVWANPVTRAQEIARQQAENSKKAAEEATAKVAAARKAAGANVRTSAKSGSAAAPLGSIDDTLSETLAAIKARG